MSTANALGNGTLPPPWTDLWAKFFEASQENMKTWLETMKDSWDPPAFRRQGLETLAKGLDAYMRSPAFLEAMRKNFEVVTSLRDQVERMSQEMARSTGVPRIADISGLFERLQIGQEALLARLSAIEHRLDALEQRRRRPGT